MVLFPKKLATLSLRCKGKWVKVDVYEPGDVVSVPANGGQYLVRYCEFELHDAPVEYLRVGVNAGLLVGLSEDQHRMFASWMPKSGLLAVIDVLCGRVEPRVKNLVCVVPTTFKVDPQKSDMRFFRKRCRFDVLGVFCEALRVPGGNLRLHVDEVYASERLTRLYDKDDLAAAMRYWSQKNILIDGTRGPTYQIDENRDEEVEELVQSYDWEEGQIEDQVLPSSAERGHDVFICHASEDKESFVRPLAEALTAQGLKVWYDEYTLTLGDSIRRSIDQGLLTSRYGVVVLSQAFFAKNWPQYELDGLAEREVDGTKVILPIWHNVTADDVRSYSPSLANRLAVQSNLPMNEIVDPIMKVVRPSQ